jgi:hypothetical protein
LAYQNLTLAQLRVLAFNRIQNSNFFAVAEVNDAINEGIRVWNLGVGFWKGRFVLTTTAIRCIYDIPSLVQLETGGITQVLMPLRMAFNSLPMDPSSIFDMDNGNPGWQAQTTQSSGVPSTPCQWGPIGCNKFYIWPADADGNNGIQIDALVRAPVLVNDGDYINIDSSEVPSFMDYVNHVLMFKRGGAPFQSTMPKMANFLRSVGMRNAHLRATGIFRGYMGEDSSRRQRPRRIPEFNLGQTTMGAR